MISCGEKRGMKRKTDSEWGMNDDNMRRSESHFWKKYLFELDAFVYEDFYYNNPETEDLNKWMMHFTNVPKCFIIKYHDLVHPKMLDYMVKIDHITVNECATCIYPMGYPSRFYFE
jgi:hypothetical protein